MFFHIVVVTENILYHNNNQQAKLHNVFWCLRQVWVEFWLCKQPQADGDREQQRFFSRPP